MDFLKKVNALILGLVVLLAVGCKDDKQQNPNPIINNKECRLTSLRLAVQGTNSGKEFVYDSQDKVSRVLYTSNGTAYPGSYEEIDYNQAGQIIKISEFASGNLNRFTTYVYNSLGQVEKQLQFLMDTRTSPAAAHQISQTTYFYNANNKVLRRVYMDVQNNDSSKTYTNYSYPSATTAKAEIYQGTGPLHMIFEYTFDDKKTPNTAFPLPNYIGYYDFQVNNVLNIKITEAFSGNKVTNHYFAYQYNSEGYPINVKETNTYNNIVAVTDYTYNCQ